MIQNGHVGQVRGPFTANKDLLDDDGAIGIFTPEKERPVIYKIGIQAARGTLVRINGNIIEIGPTGIYELDQVIQIKSLSFPSGANSDTIIDFIYTGSAY